MGFKPDLSKGAGNAGGVRTGVGVGVGTSVCVAVTAGVVATVGLGDGANLADGVGARVAGAPEHAWTPAAHTANVMQSRRSGKVNL